MNTFLSIHWNTNPILADLGFIQLRYYSLLFAGGIFLCYIYLKKYLTQQEKWEEKVFDRFATYIILGTILGARVGHCVFYEPEYYLPRPWEIFLPFSNGEFTGFQGLASHGAAAGILIALFLFCRKYKASFVSILDKLILAIPIAGACIRLGNFFNSEILGSQTDLPWGVVFERHFQYIDGQKVYDVTNNIARHPAQLYESILCVIIFLVAHNLRNHPFFQQKGKMAGLVIAWIFIWRFILEFFKENQVAFEDTMTLNMGQWLSIPLVILSFIILFRKNSKDANQTT